ncbi:putative alcohol O-acetyltransferase [Helianthus annuus]|uniref:Alcohol O-acetyltransferase n=1 Tax=Helianthus annuus TaxID=4232 RepID=A0A251U564_HELAN|nr:shikimate O-hydroxycinnamoyltransferase [Helianthus annuus]KAF5795271.1 putative alcohol O-acetyltransferase [Helianthus annuus]KAJ0538799.1 putative alcohol O-acetyltransferase [Helianthus annuus]KAJ0546785.1 putative alcohol O-acetyltransferase [Helianthus annuus]KAJ0553422.1 putative alcohol O-acetyltransferase [Helianthus annuus]KAJ0722337.1 putative alcohol O-acetyltransferase [Helianthus annuus]
MGVKAEDVSVKVIRTETVAPNQPWHDHWLPFTNLDLLVPPFDVGSFFCYKRSHESVDVTTMVDALKASLSQALTLFYPLAGELVRNAAGEPEIHCNNKGVDFIVAAADVKLQELNFHNPDVSIEGKLMPKRRHGVLAIQVTMLKCGGVVIATMFDHRVADGYSANMFVSSWADMTRSQPPSFLPSFRRSVLNARRPTVYTPLTANMFISLSNLPLIQIDPNMEPNFDQDLLISRIYYIEGDQLKKLQLLASENGCQRSKLESFTSFLWKMTAKFMEDSGHLDHVCNIAVAVDGRRRLAEGEGVEKEDIMAAHFGNVLSIPFGRNYSKDLKDMPLSSVANEVHKFLKSAANKDHFLELIDWVEDQRPTPLMSRPFAGTEKAVSIMVSSGQRFSIMDKMDFGWGKLVFGSCYVPVARRDCYVMTMSSPVKTDDWIVYMHLPRKHLNYMETHASHLFKPLTADYLKL